MSPDTGTADDVTTSRIPVNISHAVMLCRFQQLEIGSQIFFGFGFLALEVHIPEIKIEAGLRMDSSYDDKTTLGRPVDAVAGLLLD